MATAISACGGGGGGGQVQPVEPLPQLSISTPAVKEDMAVGDELSLRIDGQWNYGGSGPLYVQLRDAGTTFSLPGIQAANAAAGSDRTIALTITPLPGLPVGQRRGTLEIRACKDSACAQPYAGATASLAYELTVSAVADWQTHQGTARHAGEVPIRLNPARFKQIWEWTRPKSNEPIGGINPVVTRAGKVFVTTDVYFGAASIFALDEASGKEVWSQSLGVVPAFNPPAVGESKVFAAVTGHEQTSLFAFDLNTGKFQHKSGFSGQWPHYLAPTLFEDRVYQNGGYYGGDVIAFSAVDGAPQWTTPADGPWDMATPAVDSRSVYHYTGQSLVIVDRTSGKETARIDDPFGRGTSNAYHGSPVLGSRANVLAFSGGAFSGRASANAEQFEHRVISSFHLAERKHEWATSQSYLTTPAVGGGVVYAARNLPTTSLDAIDEATGKVMWSWTPPDVLDTGFHRNVVLTRTHVFVSTDRRVYAVDLKTRQAVWSYPAPGMLAISGGRTLYIATGAQESDGRLVAISLK